MSTPHRDEDRIPFPLNERACFDVIPMFQLMHGRRAKIHALSEDRVLVIIVHPEHLSEPCCIMG